MEERKELSTLEVQDLIWRRRVKLYQQRKGKTRKELIDHANS